ncbi:MAG TPA: hypothetical protein VL866_24170 [Pyrinomonadaceae bacterium]|nr:hypothetical protein [Pyrinomonadaceae bacterium]
MAFAVRTAGVASGGSSSGTGNRTATFTPAVGDLVVVYCCVAANTNDTPTCSDDNSGTYDLIDTLNFAISTVNYRLSVFIRTALMVNTTATTITVATGSNTSGTIHVVPCTGVTRTGANAVRSKGSQNNQAAGTAAPTLNQAALTNNGTLVAQGSADTTTTPPTNWTEILDTSQINDTVALESASRASGFTGTTITFGAASSTQFCAHAMEIDITVPLTQSASDDVNNLADARGLGYGNLHADTLNALTDTAQIVLGYSVAATDTVTLTDGEARLLGTQTTLADTLAALSDANAQLLGYLLALADTEAANWADSHQLLLSQRLALADNSFNTADAATIQLGITLALTDSLEPLTDDESRLVTIQLAFSDLITLSDSIPELTHGFNFRSTSTFVTDGADQTYVLSNTYPVTRDDFNFGYQIPGIARVDRSTGTDPRLAGAHLATNEEEATYVFRLDLPTAGTYRVGLAIGDFSASARSYIEVRDNNTPFITFSPIDTNAGEFADATGTIHTAANWPANNTTVEHVFTSTILRIAINGTFDSGDSAIAHLSISQVQEGATTPFAIGYGLLITEALDALTETLNLHSDGELRTSDSLALTDAFTLHLHVISSVLELELDDQLSLDDSCALGHGLSCVDSVSLTDSVAVQLGYLAQFSDSLQSFNDSVSLQLGQLAALSDSLTLTDSELTTLGYEEQATDTLVLTDAETNELSYRFTFTETITLTDSLALGIGLIFADTAAILTDSISTQLDHLLDFSDSLIIIDSVVITLGYAESASDSLLLTDAESHRLDQLRAFSDLLVLTDEVALGFGLLFTDNVATFTDSISVRLNELLNFSDSLVLADNVSLRLAYELQFADSIDNLLDNETQRLEQRLTFTDSLNTLSDSLTFTLGEVLSFSDSITLIDSLVLGYGLALTDDASFLMDDILTSAPQGPLREVGVTDALTPLTDEVLLRLDYLLSVADTVANLDDSSALIEGLRTSFSDLFALSDSIFPTLNHLLPLTDALVFGDSIQLQVGYEIANADVLSLSDNISLRVSYNLAFSDNLTLTDDVQLNLSYRTQLADSFTLTDSIATTLSYNQSLADSLTLTDSVQLQLGYELATSDSIALTDSSTTTLTHILSLADNVALLADSALFTPGLTLIIADNGPIFTDSVSLFGTGQLQLSDALALTDSLAKFSAGFIEFDDTLVISDSVAIDLRGPDLDEAPSDSLLLTDAISISLGNELRIELQLTDTITLTDHYFDLRYPYTPSAKRHIVVPSRARVTIPAKRTGIVVPPSDRMTRIERARLN